MTAPKHNSRVDVRTFNSFSRRRTAVEAGCPDANAEDLGKALRSIPARQGVSELGSVKRRIRRRLADLRTLEGTSSEHRRVYRELMEGGISPSEAEVRSQSLARHSRLIAQSSLKSLDSFDDVGLCDCVLLVRNGFSFKEAAAFSECDRQRLLRAMVILDRGSDQAIETHLPKTPKK